MSVLESKTNTMHGVCECKYDRSTDHPNGGLRAVRTPGQAVNEFFETVSCSKKSLCPILPSSANFGTIQASGCFASILRIWGRQIATIRWCSKVGSLEVISPLWRRAVPLGPGLLTLPRWSPNALNYLVDVRSPTVMVVNQNYDSSWRLARGRGQVCSHEGLWPCSFPLGNRVLSCVIAATRF